MEKTKMYAMKSVSDEGTWYLVNGWNRNKSFWKDEISDKTLFKRRMDCQASLTKLLKVMPEYSTDKFEIIEVEV